MSISQRGALLSATAAIGLNKKVLSAVVIAICAAVRSAPVASIGSETALAKRREHLHAARLRANERFKRWSFVLAVVTVITGGLDLVSTNAGLATGQIEGNPLMLSLQAEMGTWWSLPKMAVHLGLAYLLLWIPSKPMLVVGAVTSVAYVLLVTNNMYLAYLGKITPL